MIFSVNNQVKKTVLIFLILAVLLACRLPDVSETKKPTDIPLVPKSTEPSQASIQPTPAQPTLQPQPVKPAEPEPTLTSEVSVNPNLINYSYKGISFSFDKGLAQGVTAETVPATTDPNNVGPWEITSEYDNLKFSGYTLQGTFHKPEIFVYPVAEMAAANEGAKNKIDNLMTMLADKPGGPFKSIPFLPPWNAGQMMRTQVSYLDFQNVSGIRFLSHYGQSYSYINNHDLFYTFQGITSDGKFYISLILPVSHPSLPPTGDMPQDDYQKLADNFDQYIIGVEKDLGSQGLSSFVPDINLLDAIVKSLDIKK